VPASLTFASYAKINLTLDVLSLRADGYHSMASVLQAVSLGDRITLTRTEAPGVTLECDDPAIPSDERNLAWRAADALLRETGVGAGVHIRLEKTVPSQAGLGGGSSNAAYTLMGVRDLLRLEVAPARLAEIAAELGSDVPFFLTGGAAAARGRGESVTPLPDLPPLWFVIVKPDVGVSTAEAYRALDAIPDRQSARGTRRMEEAVREGDVERVISRMTNDFEQAVYPMHLPIMLLHDEFHMARAANARLCGSGSAVFGAARARRDAEEVARIMRLKYPAVHVCRALAREESLRLGPAVTE
jgi:4-diphosphocytidyl-2-C-methyl-D-erythritol kinase